MQALKTQGPYCKRVILNRNSKEELQCWIQSLKICNGRYLAQSHSQGLIQTDATGEGKDAVCQGMSTEGQSSKEEQLLHINVLELKAVRLALLTFSNHKSLKAVHFQIDNTTALLYLVKMGKQGNKCYWK